jgi:endonuclease/exonuclease/phosphatase (EEP) superfamily protein YafD
LISSGVVCLAIEEGQGIGSDHRPLVVDLSVIEEADQSAREPN